MMQFISLMRFLKRVLCSLFSFVSITFVPCILVFIILLPINETHNKLDTRSDIHNESTYSIEKLCENYVKSLNYTYTHENLYYQRERPRITFTYVAMLTAGLLFALILYCLCNTNCIVVIRRFMQNIFTNIRNIHWLMHLFTIIRNNPFQLNLYRAPALELAVPRDYQQVRYRDIVDLDEHALPEPPENEHMEC